MTYYNITISGLPGNGSTTLLRHLQTKLAAEGWQGYSGSVYMREYALQSGLWDPETGKFDASHIPTEVEREIDYDRRFRLTRERQIILESWLSGFMAQGVPGVLKVLLTCSDETIRMKRVAERDGLTLEAARINIEERKRKNEAKWAHMYAKEWKEWVINTGRASDTEPINFYHPALYDIVINSYSKAEAQYLSIDTGLERAPDIQRLLAKARKRSERRVVNQVLKALRG